MSIFFFDAPFVPISRKIVRKMLEMADLQPNEILYDLGSGDGRVLITAAKEFKAKAVGIELNPLLIAYSNLRILLRQVQKKVHVIWGNFFLRDISEADVVTMYLLPTTTNEMEEKLKKELKPGARVITYLFKFQNWEPSVIDEREKIYLYIN